jgi:CCR4-NOT transcriptional regulation complex NOT5 subunit
MNVVTMDPKAKQKQQRKEEMFDVLEEIKKQIEEEEITEFIACSNGENGVQIHASLEDSLGGVGLLEVGKHLLVDLQFKE